MVCSSFLFLIITIVHAPLNPSYGLKPFWSMGHICAIFWWISLCKFQNFTQGCLKSSTNLTTINVFLSCNEILPNFDPKKYDFNLYKGYLIKKIAQIQQISKKKIQNHHIFMISNRL
jgi:hypothetical protein